MKIAPTGLNQGMDNPIYGHFGSAPFFVANYTSACLEIHRRHSQRNEFKLVWIECIA